MTHTTRIGSKIAAGVAGALLGYFIGIFLGSELGAMASFARHGYEGPQGPSELGRQIGMVAGLVGGGFLEGFLVGRPTVARWCLGMAFAIGGVAFLAGIAGPILLTPDSPQGPLLGIFFTGPLGFVIGAVIGLCIGLAKTRHQYA